METLQEINELTGQFVVDHAEFVEHWTKKNIPKGSDELGAGLLAAGIGISAGMFCQTIPEKTKVKAETLKEIIVLQLNKQISQS